MKTDRSEPERFTKMIPPSGEFVVDDDSDPDVPIPFFPVQKIGPGQYLATGPIAVGVQFDDAGKVRRVLSSAGNPKP